MRTLARLYDEHMNCNPANFCSAVLPPISGELQIVRVHSRVWPWRRISGVRSVTADAQWNRKVYDFLTPLSIIGVRISKHHCYMIDWLSAGLFQHAVHELRGMRPAWQYSAASEVICNLKYLNYEIMKPESTAL